MIIKKSFAKNEPLILKIFYWIGIICLIIDFLKLPLLNNLLNKMFPILGFGIMSIFLIRMIIYGKKNKTD